MIRLTLWSFIMITYNINLLNIFLLSYWRWWLFNDNLLLFILLIVSLYSLGDRDMKGICVISMIMSRRIWSVFKLWTRRRWSMDLMRIISCFSKVLIIIYNFFSLIYIFMDQVIILIMVIYMAWMIARDLIINGSSSRLLIHFYSYIFLIFLN